jgi:hypothetical protein
MSNPVNLQRDMVYFDIGQSTIVWPTTSNRLNSSGVVNQDIGQLYVNGTTDATATNQRTGVLIQQPAGERTPYRLKLFVETTGSPTLEIGYATTQTGTDDTVTSGTMMPLIGDGEYFYLDEIICLDASDQTNPVYFSVRTSSTSTFFRIFMSVQRLNTVVPRFASTVS